MLTSKMLQWVNYGLWLVAGLCILSLSWPQIQTRPPATKLALSPQQPYYLSDSAAGAFVLTIKPASRVWPDKTGLQLGQTHLPVQTDTIGKTVYTLPVSPDDWRRTLTDQLSDATLDSAKRWPAAAQHCRLFVRTEIDSLAKNPDWKQVGEEGQIAHALLQKLRRLPGQEAYLIAHMLYSLGPVTSASINSVASLSLQTEPEPASAGSPLRVGLLGGLGLLAVLAGCVLTYSRGRNKRLPVGSPEELLTEAPDESAVENLHEDPTPVSDSFPTTDDEIADTPPAEETSVSTTPTVIEQYLARFYERYGDFYKFMQDIPIEPTPTEQQQIRRRLVEMALHAHSLARLYKHNQTLDDQTTFEPVKTEPNVWLILNQKQVDDLPENAYKRFDHDPYKFSKNHQFLQRILQSMDIGELEGALMQTVYVPPQYLKPT